jgi:hypothetical protein
MNTVFNLVVITLIVFAFVTHFFKIIQLVFDIEFLRKISFINKKQMSKSEMFLYYLLTLLVLAKIICVKFNINI